MRVSSRVSGGGFARRALSFVAFLALIITVQPAAPAAAADCTITQLEPTLAEFMVSQGVGAYARVARGRETIAKIFMTLPPSSDCTATKTQYVKITNASLTVSTGTNPNTLFTSLASKPSLATTVQPASTADPIFVVPASNLVPDAGDAEFTPTFTATITYDRKSGTVVQTGLTKIFTFSNKAFERKTNALRILVIPMGDKAQAYNTQYTSTDQTIVQNAMQTLSRMFPGPSDVNDLTVVAGGLRYIVDTAMMIDLKSVVGAYVTIGTATKFCGTSVNFTSIKSLLARALLDHNGLNSALTADRVVGVVGGNGSPTGPISFGTESGAGCADGMASVSSAESWIRLVADQPAGGGQPAKPSRSGALLGMEVAHTFGLDAPPSYHGSTIDADGGTDRAYNLSSRSRIAADHNVMNFNNTGSLWDNTTTLLDVNDFAFLLCKLNSASGTGCVVPGNVGTATGVAAGEKYVIAGATDGTLANTTVVMPFYQLDIAEVVDAASLIRVVQIDASTSPPTLVAEQGVPWSPAITHGAPTAVQTFHGAVPGFSLAAGEVRLVKVSNSSDDPLGPTAVTLFSTNEIAPPTISSISSAIPPSGGSTTMTRSQVTPRIPPKPDIVFLGDTTGSMGAALANVKANVQSIMSQVRDAQPQAQFAVASYNDEPTICPGDPYMFRIEQVITADTAAVQNAVNTWSTVGGQGCDLPEAQLNALYVLGTTGAGYRADSNRVIAWFGDATGHDPSNSHTERDAINALKGSGIRVIAVNMVNTGEGSSLDSAGQATRITSATGGVVKPANASQVSQAILDGLRDLPVTVTPEVDPDACASALTVAFSPESQTVQSRTNANFTETVTVAAGTAAGTYTCRVFFKINGKIVYTFDPIEQTYTMPDPAFIQNISITVSSAQQETVTVKGTSPQPQRLLLDLVLQCRSINFLAVMAVPPTAIAGEEATFNASVDRTNACAKFGGGGTLVAYLSDGWNRVGGDVKTDTPSAPKPPTAAIYSPFVGAVIDWDGTVPLGGSGHVAGLELPASALSWSLVSPTGVTTSLGGGRVIDVLAPMPNGWSQGIWTARLTVTSDSGTATATVTFGVHYQFLGFYDPVESPPAVNKGNTGKTFALKWSLKSGGTDVTSLSAVVSTQYGLITSCGAPVDSTQLANTSGQSTLRYDAGAKQFIFNWKTPSEPGLYVFRLTLSDGSTHDMCVNLTK